MDNEKLEAILKEKLRTTEQTVKSWYIIFITLLIGLAVYVVESQLWRGVLIVIHFGLFCIHEKPVGTIMMYFRKKQCDDFGHLPRAGKEGRIFCDRCWRTIENKNGA